jgi:hypothetical protein
MARENFLVKAHNKKEPIYFNVTSVAFMQQARNKEGMLIGTEIVFLDGSKAIVDETIKDLEQRAQKYGVMKLVE